MQNRFNQSLADMTTHLNTHTYDSLMCCAIHQSINFHLGSTTELNSANVFTSVYIGNKSLWVIKESLCCAFNAAATSTGTNLAHFQEHLTEWMSGLLAVSLELVCFVTSFNYSSEANMIRQRSLNTCTFGVRTRVHTHTLTSPAPTHDHNQPQPTSTNHKSYTTQPSPQRQHQ